VAKAATALERSVFSQLHV